MRTLQCLLLLVLPLCANAQQTTVEVFSLQHRPASGLVSVVAPLAEPGGVVRASGNNLIVRATPSQIADIRAVIAKLDTPPRQLLISVQQGSEIQRKDQSASISGRVGNDHTKIIVPPNQRQQGNVIVRDGNGNIVRGGASNSTQNRQHNTTQQLRVLEGNSALIQVGQRLPVVERQVYPSVGRPVVIQQPGYQDVTTGFRVRPRVHGEQFTLDISPQQANLDEQSSLPGQPGIDVQRLTTQVSGPLGKWVDIGGAVQQQNSQTSALGARSQTQSSRNSSVFIKVEELP